MSYDYGVIDKLTETNRRLDAIAELLKEIKYAVQTDVVAGKEAVHSMNVLMDMVKRAVEEAKEGRE